MILPRVVLSIRRPGAAQFTTFSNSSATRDENALPIRAVTVRWARSTPRDHLDPVEFEVTLRVPDSSPDLAHLVYDAELRLYVYVTPDQPINEGTLVFSGWLSSWESSTPGDGFRYYLVRAVDLAGRLAQTYVSGGGVWPEETITDRLDRLRALLPAGITLGAVPSTVGPVLAREVRHMPLLDVLRLTAPVGWTLAFGTASVSFVYARRYTPHNLQPHPIPANALEDTGRELSRRGLLTEVGLTGQYVGAPGTAPETATYYGTTRSNYTTSRATYESDVRWPLTAARTWANGQVDAATTPVVILRGTPRTVPARMSPDALRAILLVTGRHELALHVRNSPPDLDPLQYVTAALITITGRRLDLALDLAPGRINGLRRLTFDDARLRRTIFPTRPRMTEKHTSGRPLRIADLAYTETQPPQTT